MIVNSRSLSRVNKYILVRDATFFVIDFFTGDTASDLGRLQTNQVLRLKGWEGFLLRLAFTKTLRKGVPRFVALTPFPEFDVCPVRWIKNYIAVCDLPDISLSPGYFFRATIRGRDVGLAPFVGSTVNNRLHKHLTGAKLHGGETPNSFRVGLSNTLRLLGCSQDEVTQFIIYILRFTH